jgi:hypothetical protein
MIVNIMQQSTPTTVPAESLNKLLKYSFLPQKKTITLSAIATLIVEILSSSRDLSKVASYLFLNYKQSTQYRSYQNFYMGGHGR